MANQGVKSGRDDALVPGDIDIARREGILPEHDYDDQKAEREERIADKNAGERHGGGIEAGIEGGENEQRADEEAVEDLYALLRGKSLGLCACMHAPLHQRRVTLEEIKRQPEAPA